jgi:hypothetical protein
MAARLHINRSNYFTYMYIQVFGEWNRKVQPLLGHLNPLQLVAQVEGSGTNASYGSTVPVNKQNKLRGFSPQANYTD